MYALSAYDSEVIKRRSQMTEETAVRMEGRDDSGSEKEKESHKVVVFVNREPHKVKPGSYLVSEFKRLVHVDPAKELEEVVDGQMVKLDDNATITIKGGEQFFAHARRGGSS
jgi:hypothetical protein